MWRARVCVCAREQGITAPGMAAIFMFPLRRRARLSENRQTDWASFIMQTRSMIDASEREGGRERESERERGRGGEREGDGERERETERERE